MRFRVKLQQKVTYEKVVEVEAGTVAEAMGLAEEAAKDCAIQATYDGTPPYAVKSIDEVTGL